MKSDNSKACRWHKTRMAAPVLFILLITGGVWAAEDVVSDDGRELRLHEDGTWSLLSRDIYATTPDGRRIRLKPDGYWEEITGSTDNAAHGPSTRAPASSATDTGGQGGVGILLTKIEILKKKTKTQKSVRTDTRTHYHLLINNPGDKPIKLTPAIASKMVAVDSKGRKYNILELRYGNDEIKSSSSETLIVVVDGSPRWFGVTYMSLEIEQNVLGENRRIVLSKNMQDIQSAQVDDL